MREVETRAFFPNERARYSYEVKIRFNKAQKKCVAADKAFVRASVKLGEARLARDEAVDALETARQELDDLTANTGER